MWKVVQAAVQGRGHITAGIPCQDKTFYVCKQEACAIALADGAGSAHFSHFGAECTVKFITNLLIDNFDSFYEQQDPSIVRHEILSQLIVKLESQANTIGCDIKDLASTLLCAAVYQDRYLLIHLGDGVIGYQDSNFLKVASTPSNGEYCNTTIFTTSPDAEDSIKLYKGTVREEIKGFILFSDGVESIMYKQAKKEISQSLSPIFEDIDRTELSEVEQNLSDTLEEIKSHTLDDCSMIVMARTGDDDFSDRELSTYADDEDSSRKNIRYKIYIPLFTIAGAILMAVAYMLAHSYNLL